MSIEYLFVIPANPGFVPNSDIRKTALTAFKDMLSVSVSVDAVVQDEVCFIDPGGNFERVSCPFCKVELDQIWWGDAMNAAYKNAFFDLKVQLPCCDSSSTLNDLHYEMPAGFARFQLKARKAKPGAGLSADQMLELERILGTPLRQIRARY